MSVLSPSEYDRAVKTRRLSVNHPVSMQRHFIEGDILQSQIMAVLSATFPKGEQFFVDSVRNYREQLDDEELSRQVSGFIGQESMHGREHARFNRVLHELGYPTRFVDTATGYAMNLIKRVAPNSVQLAVTAAAEHFTSVLAEQLLQDDTFGSIDIPGHVKDLFRWHALEECEHKSVAYDVYRECVDSEMIRIATMQALCTLLILVASVALAATPITDRSARNPLNFIRSLVNLRNSAFARRQIALRLFEYYRPGFHPNDRDTEELVTRWRDALFGLDGELVELLS